ncbi:MAG: hypothetical protein ACI9TF_001655, partial [Paracrocinitomix sp.]
NRYRQQQFVSARSPPELSVVDASFWIHQREPWRNQHGIAVAQRYIKDQPEMHDHLRAWARTTGLQKGDVTLKDTRRPSKVELALVAVATPPAPCIAELVTGKQVTHASAVRDALYDCDYLTGR